MRLFDKKISVYEGIHGTDEYKIATVRQFLFDYPKQYEGKIIGKDGKVVRTKEGTPVTKYVNADAVIHAITAANGQIINGYRHCGVDGKRSACSAVCD